MELGAAVPGVAGLEDFFEPSGTDARAFDQGQATILDSDGSVDEQGVEGCKVSADGFLEYHGGVRCADIQTSEERERAGAIMHEYRDLVELSEVCNAF